jgi:hypothetical protein
MTPEEYRSFGEYNPNLTNAEMKANRYAEADKFHSWLKKNFEAARKSRNIIGGDTFPLSPENTKALGRAVEDDVIAAATGASKSGAMKAAAEAFPGEAKMIMGIEAGLQAIRDQAGKYDYDTFAKPSPTETPYGKSFLSYTPEGKIAGKTGAALRGLGKVASKLAGPVGAVLTAIDLGQALGEVQDKGAAKIAEDYKNSQLAESEDTGDKLMMKMEPMERGLRKSQEYMAELKKEKQYTPEERMKLKEMLSKYRADAALRSAE